MLLSVNVHRTNGRLFSQFGRRCEPSTKPARRAPQHGTPRQRLIDKNVRKYLSRRASFDAGTEWRQQAATPTLQSGRRRRHLTNERRSTKCKIATRWRWTTCNDVGVFYSPHAAGKKRNSRYHMRRSSAALYWRWVSGGRTNFDPYRVPNFHHS